MERCGPSGLYRKQVRGLGSNGGEEMSSVQQTSSLSNVSICKFAIPLKQLHHVPDLGFTSTIGLLLMKTSGEVAPAR